MRRDRLHRLLELVVLLELGRFVGLARHDLRGQLAVLGVLAAHERADLRGVGQHLGDDVARPGQRVVRARDRLADEPRRLRRRVAVGPLAEDPLRQRLEPPLARHRRPGLAARPVRRIQVLELGLAARRAQLGLELGGQLALLGDRRQDHRPPGLELDHVRALLLDRADLHLVEPAGPLLAVARDERHGVALVEHRDHRGDRAGSEPELARHYRHRVEVDRRARHGGCRLGSHVVGHGLATVPTSPTGGK